MCRQCLLILIALALTFSGCVGPDSRRGDPLVVVSGGRNPESFVVWRAAGGQRPIKPYDPNTGDLWDPEYPGGYPPGWWIRWPDVPEPRCEVECTYLTSETTLHAKAMAIELNKCDELPSECKVRTKPPGTVLALAGSPCECDLTVIVERIDAPAGSGITFKLHPGEEIDLASTTDTDLPSVYTIAN